MKINIYLLNQVQKLKSNHGKLIDQMTSEDLDGLDTVSQTLDGHQ